MRKRRIAAGVALLCGVATAAAVALASRANPKYGAFDQRAWKKPVAYCVESPRTHMVDGLIAQRLKTGMPMRMVRALLGRPDGQYPDEWVYYVTREDSVTDEGCVLLSLGTDGNTLTDARLDYDSG
jgi:outer membrane protein assembly factor BamE (lipoprotein component of BamABCDE complex)